MAKECSASSSTISTIQASTLAVISVCHSFY
jgi:ribosomal protein L31